MNSPTGSTFSENADAKLIPTGGVLTVTTPRSVDTSSTAARGKDMMQHAMHHPKPD